MEAEETSPPTAKAEAAASDQLMKAVVTMPPSAEAAPSLPLTRPEAISPPAIVAEVLLKAGTTPETQSRDKEDPSHPEHGTQPGSKRQQLPSNIDLYQLDMTFMYIEFIVLLQIKMLE